MSGLTLQELVDRRGPLAPADAVARILDVIEGLQEAHRLGVIHRDVKPSNCFVLDDGRVKVGDFGLAKSLVASVSLTRTGTFLGTLLYAPPEQIKGEAIDVRTDVYSVCATLYFLLAGRAPFEGKDAAATLARTVSEAPPRLRPLVPGLSRRLEQVVLRGLARQREDRWRDLEELRLALLPFAPGQLRPAGLPGRFGAFLLDMLLFLPLGLTANFAAETWLGSTTSLVVFAGLRLLDFLPWWFLEGWFGWSPGKWLLNLRVVTPRGTDPPGLGRAALRILVFYALLWLPSDVMAYLMSLGGNAGLLFMPLCFLPALGAIPLLVTMRARNGYRGLHELLSNTRVVRWPWPERQRPLVSRGPDRLAELTPCAPDLPERLGPYPLRGALGEADGATILLGEDPALGRKIWVRVAPEAWQRLSEARRQVNRPTRLAWLTGGVQDGRAWDGCLAPNGSPLADLVSPRQPLNWGQTRPLLLQLCEEVEGAARDGTLPARLHLDQVWVQSNGRLQLLDAPVPAPPPGRYEDAGPPLRLVRMVAALALEGELLRRRRGRHIEAPVPAPAAALLDRLLGGPDAFRTVAEVHAALVALEGQPTHVNRAQRSAHLTLLTVVLAPLLLILFGLRFLTLYADYLEGQQPIHAAESVKAGLDDEDGQEALVAELNQRHAGPPLDRAAWRDVAERRRQEAVADQARWQEVLRDDWLGKLVLSLPDSPPPRAAPSPLDLQEVVRPPASKHPFFLVMAMGFLVQQWMLIAGLVLWALAFRGGFTLRFLGIGLRRRNGRAASHLQCAWRTLLFWLPVGGVLSLSHLALALGTEGVLASALLWYLAAAVLAGYIPLALWWPERSLHDRLAGTYLMPS
jgi:hypothetical protein